MAHTPGPWERKNHLGEPSPIYISSPEVVLICDQGGFDTYVNLQNDDHALIAAAPDLLVACHVAAQWIYDTSWGTAASEAIHRTIAAAIAKAEGRS